MGVGVVEVGGLVGPVGGVASFAAGEVEEVEAVGGGGVAGAGGELPPELGSVVAAGEVEQAGELQGAVRVDTARVAKLCEVFGGVDAVEGFG